MTHAVIHHVILLAAEQKEKKKPKITINQMSLFLHFISIEFCLPMACVKCRLARVARVVSRYWSDGCAISDCDAETGHNIITS